jgi:hypothetical protein
MCLWQSQTRAAGVAMSQSDSVCRLREYALHPALVYTHAKIAWISLCSGHPCLTASQRPGQAGEYTAEARSGWSAQCFDKPWSVSQRPQRRRRRLELLLTAKISPPGVRHSVDREEVATAATTRNFGTHAPCDKDASSQWPRLL